MRSFSRARTETKEEGQEGTRATARAPAAGGAPPPPPLLPHQYAEAIPRRRVRIEVTTTEARRQPRAMTMVPAMYPSRAIAQSSQGMAQSQ